MTVEISAQMVKELREKTGAGILDTKKALVEAEGNMDKAMEILRQKGIASADKKMSRIAAEGLIHASISADGKTGVLLEVNCETDFVAKNTDFQQLVNDLAQHILHNKPANNDELLQQEFTGSGITIDDTIKANVGKIGEKINFRRFTLYPDAGASGKVSYYIHGGKIGVLMEVHTDRPDAAETPEFKQLIEDLCMQVSFSAPDYIGFDEIGPEVFAEEKRIESGKDDLKGKPADMIDKIVTGRVNKLLGQRCLLEQNYIRDNAITIAKLLSNMSATLGQITVKRFIKYDLGEGLEKREDNFVQEVMAQMSHN